MVCIVEYWDWAPASHLYLNWHSTVCEGGSHNTYMLYGIKKETSTHFMAGSDVWWRGGAVAWQTQASRGLLIYWLQAQVQLVDPLGGCNRARCTSPTACLRQNANEGFQVELWCWLERVTGLGLQPAQAQQSFGCCDATL